MPKKRSSKKEDKTKSTFGDTIAKEETSNSQLGDTIEKTEEKPKKKRRLKKENDTAPKKRKTDVKINGEGEEKEEKEATTTKTKPLKWATDAKVKPGKTAADVKSSKTKETKTTETKAHEETELSGLTVEEIAENAITRKSPEPRKKWQIVGPPITEADKVPDGWTVNEDDIEEFDIEANIERNIERIKEGILPQFFQIRLMRYEQMKKDRETFEASEPGVTWSVRVRIDTLKRIETSLSQDGDPDNQLLNVRAIIAAYRNKGLEWKPPLVTYWLRGEIYKGPEEFDSKNLARYLEDLAHPKSWWVEGMDGPGPTSINFIDAFTPLSQEFFMHEIRLAIRPAEMPDHLKGSNKYVEYDFLDDTGSPNMLIYEQDRWEMENICNYVCQEMGQTFVSTAAGSATMRVIHLEVSLLSNPMKLQLVPWTKVACYIMPGMRQVGEPRISGIWLRHLLYTLTRPDNKGMLFLSDEGFCDTVNIMYPVQPRPPPAHSYFPRRGATEVQQEQILGYVPNVGPIFRDDLPPGHWYGYSPQGYPGYFPPRNVSPLLEEMGAKAQNGGFLRRMWRFFTPPRQE
ncbi:uncharacterized protein N7483_012686 [Penicillium malachiteum]|uniref:uncharacterized protein n=1 Tax=Penicillium malachiteum TaxID=1324776 RepID=UPI002546FD15|nr:uncharacterized protein N7483_012686 [Penicillium malachiteum]KAJ5715505.1 hypothetical protein N7483_012686 [Penicillium malachiteum]